ICPHGNVLKLYQNGISRLSHFDWYFICPRVPYAPFSIAYTVWVLGYLLSAVVDWAVQNMPRFIDFYKFNLLSGS
ncbi:hypothetical protein, partial [Microcoleus sp. PH2017_15_JOR_U_A]